MSANVVAYWERELNEATGRLRRFEQEQNELNPFLHEQLRQEREQEVKVCAAKLQLAHQEQAQ
jgi:hypothetical protein